MKTLKQLERLRKAHKLIKQGNTGSPSEFSNRLHISERELYRILEYLKELDAVISFSRNANSYYYTGDFDLFVSVSVQALVNQELITIYAGNTTLKRHY
jgi:predicted DNA-binding transcriptional regulator YafY